MCIGSKICTRNYVELVKVYRVTQIKICYFKWLCLRVHPISVNLSDHYALWPIFRHCLKGLLVKIWDNLVQN